MTFLRFLLRLARLVAYEVRRDDSASKPDPVDDVCFLDRRG